MKAPLVNILTSFDETSVKKVVEFVCHLANDLKQIVFDFQAEVAIEKEQKLLAETNETEIDTKTDSTETNG